MAFNREGDTVTLTMTVDQFETLLMGLGIAAGSSYDNKPMFRGFIRLANQLNEGNPQFIPYELPDDPSPAAST